jgi:hypothetical protein
MNHRNVVNRRAIALQSSDLDFNDHGILGINIDQWFGAEMTSEIQSLGHYCSVLPNATGATG